MFIFGKKNISEADAINLFVMQMHQEVTNAWPSICEEINKMANIMSSGKTLFSNLQLDSAAKIEFHLAIVTGQMRTLINILPHDQGMSISFNIIKFLAKIFNTIEDAETLIFNSKYYGEMRFNMFHNDLSKMECVIQDYIKFNKNLSKPERVILAYIKSFENYIQTGDSLLYGQGSLFYMRLHLSYDPNYHHLIPMNIFLLTIIDDFMVTIGGAWWKNFFAKYKIIFDK